MIESIHSLLDVFSGSFVGICAFGVGGVDPFLFWFTSHGAGRLHVVVGPVVIRRHSGSGVGNGGFGCSSNFKQYEYTALQ